MNYTQEELLEIKGFNHGYVLAGKSLKISEHILTFNHHIDYLKGFIKGKEQFEKDKELFLSPQNKLEQRRAKLKQIAEQEKNREQNEHER